LARLKWSIVLKSVRLPLHQQTIKKTLADRDKEDRDGEEDFTDWIAQLHGFMHQINVVDTHLLPTSDSLPLPFPCISTPVQATDLSEEDTSSINTTDTDIDDYILAPQSVQAKVDDSHLLKVFQ
jgi:hypothetical protein